MSPIEDLIQTAQRLSDSLDRAAANEKLFTLKLTILLEQYALEMTRMTNDLKEIKSYVGVS